jgi:hypothetical protein
MNRVDGGVLHEGAVETSVERLPPYPGSATSAVAWLGVRVFVMTVALLAGVLWLPRAGLP